MIFPYSWMMWQFRQIPGIAKLVRALTSTKRSLSSLQGFARELSSGAAMERYVAPGPPTLATALIEPPPFSVVALGERLPLNSWLSSKGFNATQLLADIRSGKSVGKWSQYSSDVDFIVKSQGGKILKISVTNSANALNGNTRTVTQYVLSLIHGTPPTAIDEIFFMAPTGSTFTNSSLEKLLRQILGSNPNDFIITF